jgi:hypothetical protein
MWGVAVVLVGLAGCGGGRVVVVRVGDGVITKRDLEGWMAVVAPSHVVPDSPRFSACVASKSSEAGGSFGGLLRSECAREYVGLKRRALSFLIRSEWFVLELSRRGVVLPGGLERRVVGLQARGLQAAGATAADVKLKVDAELAASVLDRRLLVPRLSVSRSQELAYYRRHPESFATRPEWRYFKVLEHIPRREAVALLEAARRGVMVTTTDPRFFREEVSRASVARSEGDFKTLHEAIFAARPHVLYGPVKFNAGYTVLEVTKVKPAEVRPFEDVASSIEKLLRNMRHRQLRVAFLDASRSRWKPATDCKPGYVVAQCRQHSGSTGPEALESWPGQELEAE